MSDTSPALGLPFIQPAQAQKHVTHNEALRVLDAVTQLSVESADLATPPANADKGARYIVAASGQGAWAGQDHTIALFTGTAWEFYAPQSGWRADVAPTGNTLRFDGSIWQPIDLPETLPLLGLNTSADSTNRLAASAEATLLTHEGAGHRLKINKSGAADTASLLFQTDWSGRAEMGTTGNDDFSIKVSPDGTQFFTAMTVDAASGLVAFPQSVAPRERLATDRTYYVRMNGNDVNTGLTDNATGAFRTLQHAVDVLLSLDCGPNAVTIDVGPGDYDEDVNISGLILGSATYRIVGDTTDPSQVKTKRFACTSGAVIAISGFELTASDGITVQSDAKVQVDRLHFAGSGPAIQIKKGFVDANHADLHFSAGVNSIANMYNYAYLSAFGTNFDLASGIVWGASGAFYMHSFCLAWLQSAQFSGDTTGATGLRYKLGISSILNTSNAGANFVPGSAAGVTNTNSLYI